VELLSDHCPSPSKQVAAAEAVRAVQVGVATLPHDQRDAVVLRYFRGLSVDETAAKMRRTPGAVRGLVDRAKQSLRCALGNSSRWFSRK
jgi:RNA polymerase sigma-70 factor (ECF subfamily)